MRDFQIPGRSPVFASNGLCATSHPLAAKAAVQILEAGGNAVDAAIAGAVLLGFCEPQMTGIGGDCFALFTPPGSSEVKALNGSGRAPAALDAADIRAEGHAEMPLLGPLPATLPGAIDAFCTLSNDWGKLGLATCLAPAIHYAEAGIPIAPRVARDWAKTAHRLINDSAKAHFLINGEAPKLGQIYRNPHQAEALRRIALEGRDGFYDGEVAEDIIAALTAAGGVHTLDDLAQTACTYTTPISGTYAGIELLEHPPNGQGATAILLLNMLKHFDIAGMDPFGAPRTHIEAEASKLAYDARNRLLADPDHTARTAHMLAPETAAALAALINPNRALPNPTEASEAVHKETVYITVVDKDRMAVSLIYSNFDNFGCGLASEKFGILVQNRGAGFTLSEGHPNEAMGGKRPMHTIIPGMLRQSGRVLMPFGVMGGQFQSHGHARFISNMRDFGMDPQSAIDAPRAFPTQGTLQLESPYSEKTRAALTDLGHAISDPPGPLGGAQAIQIHDTGVLEGASDPRKDGCALGY